MVRTKGTYSGQRMIEGVYESDVKGRSNRGRPCTRLLDRVKKAYKTRLFELSDAMVMCMDRGQWMNFGNCATGVVNV